MRYSPIRARVPAITRHVTAPLPPSDPAPEADFEELHWGLPFKVQERAMYGIVNRALQKFLTSSYGVERLRAIGASAKLAEHESEALRIYDDQLTMEYLNAAHEVLGIPVASLLEDFGTWLVSPANGESLRRLIRFGGVDFVDFLHSLEELPERARLALPMLALPRLRLHVASGQDYTLYSEGSAEFAHVLLGLLRAMADDYGTLASLEYCGASPQGEEIKITIHVTAFSDARSFPLASGSR